MGNFLKIVTVLGLFLVCGSQNVVAQAPGGENMTRKEKKAQKQQEKLNAKRTKQKEKEAKKAEKDAFKRYYSIQCKAVRKRLKKQKRRANKKNKRKWHD